MIRVHRTSTTPGVLVGQGQQQTQSDCLAYDQDPLAYISGRKHFQYRRYYRVAEVKTALRTIQSDKCCYCENKYRTPAYLHVEHFRPKGAVRQDQSSGDEYPGYYWLAYQWSNLLLACFDCNTSSKGTTFPLRDPAQRARSHHDNIGNEQPLYINPADEDPRKHIRFKRDTPFALTDVGRRTIDGLDLRRSALAEERLELFAAIEVIVSILKQPHKSDNQDLQQDARGYLRKAIQPTSKFSSMVLDYVILNGLTL